MPNSPGRAQIRGLFDLYQEERKREERTKGALRSLQQNSDEVLKCKMRLVEKILDTKVKDELALLREATNVALVETSNDAVRRRAREKIQRNVEGRIPQAKERYGDQFVSQLDDMVDRNDADVRERVRAAVNDVAAPKLKRLREQRAAALSDTQGTKAIIDDQCARMLQEGHQSLVAEHAGRMERELEDRRRRVQAAESKFLKAGEVKAIDLSKLLDPKVCEPDSSMYHDPTGQREAAINDLRLLIYRQREEEERLILDRSAKLNNMESEHEELQSVVDKLTQKVAGMQEELELKEREVDEMKEAQVPGTGRWARDLMDLEQSVEFQEEEEMRLKRDYESVAAASSTIDADKRMLNEKVHDELEELSRLQEQYRELVDKIEEQLVGSKDRILAVRQENIENTRRINDMRWRAWSGGDEVQDAKREARERLNQTISQLAIDERLQSMLAAKIQILNDEEYDTRQKSQRALEQGRHELARLKQEQDQIAAENTRLIEHLTDLKTGQNWQGSWAQQGRPPPHDEQQLKEQIKDLKRQWGLTLFDTAQSTSETKAKLMMNAEENDLLLDRMGNLVVTNQILDGDGVHAENSATAQLAQSANRLYDDLAKASYREAKLHQLLRIFRDLQTDRQASQQIPPLTGPRPVARHERRGRREAKQRAFLAREMARANVALHSSVSPAPAPGGAAAPAPPPSSASPRRALYERPPTGVPGPPRSTPEQEHRLRVINFIKSEIQPLYDSEQVTKKRFIDIVARASSAFLETRPAAAALSGEDQQWLQRKIQEVITLQDEARSRRRAQRERESRERAGGGAPPALP